MKALTFRNLCVSIEVAGKTWQRDDKGYIRDAETGQLVSVAMFGPAPFSMMRSLGYGWDITYALSCCEHGDMGCGKNSSLSLAFMRACKIPIPTHLQDEKEVCRAS
jgi:hypothetical protein